MDGLSRSGWQHASPLFAHKCLTRPSMCTQAYIFNESSFSLPIHWMAVTLLKFYCMLILAYHHRVSGGACKHLLILYIWKIVKQNSLLFSERDWMPCYYFLESTLHCTEKILVLIYMYYVLPCAWTNVIGGWQETFSSLCWVKQWKFYIPVILIHLHLTTSSCYKHWMIFFSLYFTPVSFSMCQYLIDSWMIEWSCLYYSLYVCLETIYGWFRHSLR